MSILRSNIACRTTRTTTTRTIRTLFWRVNRTLTIVADGFTDALQEAREQEASDKADAAAAAIRAAGGAGTAVAAAAAVGDGDNNESDDEQMENKTESCCFGKGQCDYSVHPLTPPPSSSISLPVGCARRW